ncbi:MAG: hypothetical protein FWG64_03695 [Firmicutes bacterium]|nr:hypothetical protein [Bacillota bacterium]
MYVHANGDRYAILKCDFLDLGDGETISEGLMLDVAKQLKKLLEENKNEEFFRLVSDTSRKLSHEDHDLFHMIIFPEHDTDIWNRFWEIYYETVPIEEFGYRVEYDMPVEY